MKKASFIQLSRAVWKQNQFKQTVCYGSETALTVLYIISAPNGNMTGVFELTLFDLQRFTGLSEESAKQSINNLCEMGFCEYDIDEQYIWDKGSINRHLGRVASTQQIKGIVNNFNRLREEDAPFIDLAYEMFAKFYPEATKFTDVLIERSL
jgi:hypothetical protein